MSSAERLLIVTDAWTPQVNGVVTTVGNLAEQLEARGFDVALMTPRRFFTIPTSYPNLRLALPLRVGREFRAINPDRVLIMTEGPLGFAVRNYCVLNGIPFLTGFTTKWPEYFMTHLGFPPRPLGYRYLRWFHRPASGTLVATPTLSRHLQRVGFQHLLQWNRGVDTQRFYPLTQTERDAFAAEFLPAGTPVPPRPYSVYVGRVSQEKNIEAFLKLDLPGTKWVVGGGPAVEPLKKKYPQVKFLGQHSGEALRQCYGAADLMVFPSKTDTFGLVMLEALASGTPVVAYDVLGPHDVLAEAGAVGQLATSDDDLQTKAVAMLQQRQTDGWETGELSTNACVAAASRYSWDSAVEQLLANWPNRHTQPAPRFSWRAWLNYRFAFAPSRPSNRP